MGDERAQSLLQMYGQLKGERLTWDSLWQDLADVCHPRRAEITTSQPGGTAPERTNIAQAFDGTAQRAADTLARGQASRITPMGSRWFAFRPPPELAGHNAAQAWYSQAGEIVAQKLYASNYYATQFETYLDRGVFGTAAKQVMPGPGGKGLHFRSLPVGTYCIAEDYYGTVDTIFRCYQMTARQIVDVFREDGAIPPKVLECANDPAKRETKFEIIHAIVPRHHREPGKIDARNKPFASYHILKEGEHTLAESGFDDFPVTVSRWSRWGETPWGWAPAYHALPEASQANYLEEMLDALAEVAAFPRVLIPDGSLKTDVDYSANGLTFYDPNRAGGGPPTEWLTGGRYDIGKDRAQDKRRAIEEAFFVNLFNPVSQLSDDATATHIRAIVTESRELFHPIFANMVREDLAPTLRRAFALLLRSGEIPPPPRAVYQEDGLGAFIADPDVEMVSQMALAMEQNHLARLNDILTVASATGDPAWLQGLAPERIMPSLVRFMGLPEDFNRTPEELEAIAAAGAQQQQAEQALAVTEGVRNLGGVEQAGRAADMLAGVIPPGA